MLKADLHIHTNKSMDCSTAYEKIIERCQKLSINCIAIADHGTAEGALEMQKLAPFKVIVAEECLTTQGEIMGMFLKETVPSGLTPQETIKRIHEQGALVNIPHPFELLRGSSLKDWAVEDIAAEIDLMEVLNARSPLPKNTNRARAFAEAHGIPGGAGSDAHTVMEIGNAYVEMAEFSTPQEFLQSLRNGTIYGKRSSMFVKVFSTWAKVKNQFLTRRK